MVLLATDVFVLLTQVLLWVVVGLFAWYALLKALPRAFLGGLVVLLFLGVIALTFFKGSPAQGLLGDVWRVLSVPFTPLGIILILLLIAFSDLVKDKGLSKMSVTLVRVAVPLLFVLSLPAVSYFLAQRAEAESIQTIRPAAVESIPAGARRVIVVLANNTTRLQLRPRLLAAPGAALRPPGPAPLIEPPEPLSEAAFSVITNQPPQLTESGNRLTYTAQLYQEEKLRGTSPLVIVSAGPRPERARKEDESPESISQTADASRFLQRLGISPTDIVEDALSPTIHDSAMNVQTLLQQRNINYGNQLVLVTSALEMNRSTLTFNREFQSLGVTTFSVIPRPTDFYSLPPKDALRPRVQGKDLIERNFRVSDILPDMDAFSLNSKVISEYMSSIYYFLRGWIRPVKTI